MVAKDNRVSLADEALSTLQASIISGTLRPNQRLIESQLAKEMGMSRTPLREAFRQLEMMGYVTILPNGGVIVTEHTPKEIRDLYEIREALETTAIRLACSRVMDKNLEEAGEFHKMANEAAARLDYDEFSRLNGRFHDELLSACGNEKLLALVRTTRDQYFDRRILRTLSAAEWKRMLAQHGAMLEAVKSAGISRAQKIVQDHIRMMLRIAIERL